jgi:predicted ArsR family transcriptional regulator
MTDGTWKVLDDIRDDIIGRGFGSPELNLDGRLNAAMELLADILPTADAVMLSDGSLAAAHALSVLMANSASPVDRQSADFAAGRLAAIVDILGYAASATAASDDVDKARSEPYASIIRALAEGPLQDSAVAFRLGVDEEGVSAGLHDLRKMGMVTNRMQGWQVFNALTPVGVLLAEEGEA